MTLTDEQLDAIDRIVSAGGRTLCEERHPEVDLLDDVLRETFDTYAALPDFKARTIYERSLWVRRSNDSRCVPEIYALAALRFGVLPANATVMWVDGDRRNNIASNVIVVIPKDVKGDGRIARNQFGAPANSKEYRQKYYAVPANKERQKKHSKRYADRQRIAKRVAEAVVSPEELAVLRRIIMGTPHTGGASEEARIQAALLDPKTQREIVLTADLLMDIDKTMSREDALAQARDSVLNLQPVHALVVEEEDLLPVPQGDGETS